MSYDYPLRDAVPIDLITAIPKVQSMEVPLQDQSTSFKDSLTSLPEWEQLPWDLIELKERSTYSEVGDVIINKKMMLQQMGL